MTFTEIGGHNLNHLLWKEPTQSGLPDAELYRCVVQNITAVTYLAGLDGKVLFVSPQIEELVGYDPDSWVADPMLWLTTLHPDDAGRVLNERARALGMRQTFRSEYRLVAFDGTEVWVQEDARVVPGTDGEPGSVYGLLTDISERKRVEENLRNLVFLDELTGLYNRRGFNTLAEGKLKLAARRNSSAVLLFVDVDHLKQINDVWGHGEGDRALQAVAAVLKRTFRETDIIGRNGGDEFTVFAVDADGNYAGMLSERLHGNLAALNARDERPYRLSVTVGATHVRPDAKTSLDQLMNEADRAMYHRKAIRP